MEAVSANLERARQKAQQREAEPPAPATAVSMNALRAQQKKLAEEARQGPPAAAEAPLTELHLAAIEALRRRDGITRAAALTRVRELSEAAVQDLLDTVQTAPPLPSAEGSTPPLPLGEGRGEGRPFVELPELEIDEEPEEL